MKVDFSLNRTRLMTSAATGLAILFGAAPAALAQEDESVATIAAAEDEQATMDTVVVTGIRAAIQNSVEAKRNSDLIVEAISAEDIGKLPDNSIAESIARLPGLAAQRVRGRAQSISVRGLGPDFTTTLLNGREQVSSGDNRGVEFDQYPSELLNQVLIYKTPNAQLVAQGLAGTADLRTVRPLEYNDRVLAVNARYEWLENTKLNADSEDTGYRLSGTYIDQFANGTIGLALGIAHQQTPTQAEKYESNYDTRDGNRVIENLKTFAESRELERTAVIGILEFEPTATFNTSIDAMYTTFTDAGVRRGIELPLGTWLGCCTALSFTGDPVVQDGVAIAGSFDNVFGVVRNDYQDRASDLYAFGWNTQWQPFDLWTLEADLSYSKVTRDALDFESYAGRATNRDPADDRVTFAFANGRYRYTTEVDYGDPSLMFLTDPGGWGQAGFRKVLSTDDELAALRLSAKRELENDSLSSIEGGVYVSQREKTRQTDEFFIDLASGLPREPIPQNALLAPTNMDYIANFSVVAYDPRALLSSGVYTTRPLPLGFIPDKQWTVEETVVTAYGQLNIDANLQNVPVKGNVGIQVVSTDQKSTGPIAFGADFLGVVATDGDKYTEVLPSANFNFQLTDDTFLRLGFARTMARARMDDMRASQGIGINTQICGFDGNGDPFFIPGAVNPNNNQYCITGGSGQPKLRPYMADSFDVSLERYFGSGGYVSAAAFYKQIDTWVFGSVNQLINTAPTVDAIFGAGFAAANPGIEQGSLSVAQNTNGGWLRGVEFAGNLPFDLFLPEPLDGFGILASYSVTDSEIQPPGAGQPITIPGLSERIANVTVYYEKRGFEARVSSRYRSPFLAELPDFTGQPDFREAFSENVIDAQIGYRFQAGPLEGLSLVLSANNLTDERFGTFQNGNKFQVRNYEEYGAIYSFGISWRY